MFGSLLSSQQKNVVYMCDRAYAHYLHVWQYLRTLSTCVTVPTHIIYMCDSTYAHYRHVTVPTHIIYMCDSIYAHYLHVWQYLRKLSTCVTVPTHIIYMCDSTYAHYLHVTVPTHIISISIISLTLSLLTSYIYGAPSKARNANVVYIWTYVWQRWKPSLSICCTMFQHWINAEWFPVSSCV